MSKRNKSREMKPMNIAESQKVLHESLTKINVTSTQDAISLQNKTLTQYIQTSQDFSARLSDTNDLAGLFNLQRELNSSLLSNAQQVIAAQNEIIKSAFNGTVKAVQTAFSSQNQNPDDASPEKS